MHLDLAQGRHLVRHALALLGVEVLVLVVDGRTDGGTGEQRPRRGPSRGDRRAYPALQDGLHEPGSWAGVCVQTAEADGGVVSSPEREAHLQPLAGVEFGRESVSGARMHDHADPGQEAGIPQHQAGPPCHASDDGLVCATRVGKLGPQAAFLPLREIIVPGTVDAGVGQAMPRAQHLVEARLAPRWKRIAKERLLVGGILGPRLLARQVTGDVVGRPPPAAGIA